MSDATLSPYIVQNEQIFQEYLELDNGHTTLPDGMPKKHANVQYTSEYQLATKRLSLNS
ncbi:unnamed protein product [marine sediment metagenome]|uniref:Uncharacterized protein n=1 Tax=marine sediment metagenome TaxID=412755 RepID=X1JAJ0_9ZZZZ